MRLGFGDRGFQRKWLWAVVLSGLSVILVLASRVEALPIRPLFYLAQTSDSVEQLQQQRQQIEDKRSDVQKERGHLQNLEKAAKERLGGLHQTIKTTSEQITVNQKVLDQANQHLKALQVELAKAEKSYQGKQFATVARLRFLQRQQISRGWALLLDSKDFNEFLDRRYQLKQVYEGDRRILADLKADADVLEKRRREVESQKNEVALITQELLAQKAEYQAQAKSQESLIDRLRQDRKALEAAEEQLSRDSDNLADLIQQRLATSRGRGLVRGTGVMSFPCDGPITSSFGYRMHPILGYTRFHTGLDFGVDYGSPIRSANAGSVIFAGWYGGYGQAVIIDHGNGVTTLYGHTSELYVSEGQTVQRGQVIAAVGSTGLSTGPHLHFEVRLNGEPVDPANYL